MSNPEKSRPHGSPAARRLAERVKEVVSQLIPKLKDPRIGFVTVTDVRMSRDNERATIYYTVLPDTPEERERAEQGLQSATGLMRRDLGAVLHVRHVPELVFSSDEVADQGRRIEKILADLDDKGGPAADPQAPGLDAPRD